MGRLSFKVSFMVVVSIFVFSVNVIASWGPQQQQVIQPNANCTAYFIPGVAGNHQIEFLNQWDVYNGGSMLSYWGSSNDIGNWHYWTTSDVLCRTRYQNLYAGSDDIIFKFVFVNTTDNPVEFFWRFYTD